MKPLSWNEYVRLAMSYAIFSENEDTGWTVEIPVLPGCVTWGETRMDAAAMAEDAVQRTFHISARFQSVAVCRSLSAHHRHIKTLARLG